jgi:hypothetical protein
MSDLEKQLARREALRRVKALDEGDLGRSDLTAAVTGATAERPAGSDPDAENTLEDDPNIKTVSDIITSESRAAASRLIAELSAPAVIASLRQSVVASQPPPDETQGSDSQDAGDIESQLEAQESEFLSALQEGRLGELVETNAFARIAMTKAMTEMREKIEVRLSSIKAIKPTPYIGRHADLRNAPITSLLEYVRFIPELGVAFIAGNSAKNMIAELMAQSEQTAQLSYNNRLLVASAAGIVMSYMAYQLRHSLYKDAQERGHTYAQLPVAPLTATVSAYKNVLRKHPVRTSLRTAMAFGVAIAGGNVLLNLAGVSGKSVEFGTSVLTVTQPLDKQMREAGGVMDAFFKQIEDRCKAIVNAEVDISSATKGTGKGTKSGYGPQAAAKDFLCFGKTEQGRVPPQAVVAFRQSIGIRDGESIPQLYKRLWEERATQRAALLTEFATALGEFQKLVQTEADTSFATHVERATLKHIPENLIPAAKARLVAAVKAYVSEINAYGSRVDELSKRIATEGLRAANAAGQDIEIQTPKVGISTTTLEQLPNSPVGKTGFFLSPELAPGTKDTLSKVPGLNFITPFLSDNPQLLTLQLTLLALLAYLGAENIPNAFFVARERMRSRRLARELDPKRRDYFTTLDKIAEQIADIVIEVLAPYKQLVADTGSGLQSREQLISAIKYAIVGDMEDAPDGTERPLVEYARERMQSVAHMLKHLYDWGPDEAVETDRAIGRLRSFLDALRKGSPEKNARRLAEMDLPGSEILLAIFDKDISSDPVKFADVVAKSEIRALQHNVRYLVLKMQARQFALNQLSTQLGGESTDVRHSAQTRDFLSNGIVLPLDGSQKITVSADEVRYYRAWAELAAEQEQDQRDLLRVAVAGKTYWDRKFGVDHTLGTVEIPQEFREEFIASVTAQPAGDQAMLVNSYKQMLDRMLERQSDANDFVETLNYLNESTIPELITNLEDEPRLNDTYSLSFHCAFSTRHGGPIIRCDLFDAETGTFAAAVESPYVIGESASSASELAQQIRAWFGHDGPGRLEAIARARHHELLEFIRRDTSASVEDAPTGISLTDPGTTEQHIETAQKSLLYRFMLGRQERRIKSIITTPLEGSEMALFELPRDILQSDIAVAELRSRVGLGVDGLFQIRELMSRLRARPAEGVSVTLDTQRGILLVTRAPAQDRSGFLRRKPLPTTSPYPLSALRDIDGFLRELERKTD